MCVCVCMCVYVCMYIYIYMYIWRERDTNEVSKHNIIIECIEDAVGKDQDALSENNARQQQVGFGGWCG